MMRARYSLRKSIWRCVIIARCPWHSAAGGLSSDISHIYHRTSSGSIGLRRLGSLDYAGDRWMAQRVGRPALEDNFAALNNIEAVGELRHVVDVGFGDEHGV